MSGDLIAGGVGVHKFVTMSIGLHALYSRIFNQVDRYRYITSAMHNLISQNLYKVVIQKRTLPTTPCDQTNACRTCDDDDDDDDVLISVLSRTALDLEKGDFIGMELILGSYFWKQN